MRASSPSMAGRAAPQRRLALVLRNKFVAGLIVLVPIAITVQALRWLFTFVDGLAQPLAESVIGRPVPGIGFLTTLGIVFITGVLFSAGPLKVLLEALEGLLDDVPLVGSVYGTLKKVLEGFGSERAQSAFQRFVLARLPGRTTPGFLTGSFTLTRGDRTVERLCTVYVPTNHLYVGDVVVLPERDVLFTDLSVEDGVSLVLSAGASVPAAVAERRDAPE